MKILLVHDYGMLAGGSERVTFDLREGLRARGHDVRLFASTARPLPLPNEADYRCYGTSGKWKRVLQVFNPWASRGLRRAIADFAPDVVHVRLFLTQLSPAILPELAGVPSILHLGGYHTVCPLSTRLLPDGSACTFRAGIDCYRQGCVSALGLARTVLQLGACRTHQSVLRLIVANSHSLAKTLSENDVKVDAVIWNGTAPCTPRAPLSDPPTVAFVGRLQPRKGVDDLLRATALLAGRVPALRVLVMGEGPDRQRLEALTREHGISGRVTFRGHVEQPQLDPRLRGAWVQAVPSTYREPLANVTLEAMMRGTAVVATKTGGTSEAVIEGETGFLVPSGDVQSLADSLLRLLTDRACAERFGAAGRERALTEFSLARMLTRWEDTYASVLASR